MSLHPDMQPDELRGRLRALAAAAGLTPSGLAEAAGLAPSQINKFLAGEVRNPSGATLLRLERAALDRICIQTGAAPTAPAAITQEQVLRISELMSERQMLGLAAKAMTDFKTGPGFGETPTLRVDDSFIDLTTAEFETLRSIVKIRIATRRNEIVAQMTALGLVDAGAERVAP